MCFGIVLRQQKDPLLYTVPPLERGMRLQSISLSWWSAELLGSDEWRQIPGPSAAREGQLLTIAPGESYCPPLPCSLRLSTEPARAAVPLRKEQRGWDAAPLWGGESPTRAKHSIAVMFESSLKNYFFIQFLTKQLEAPKRNSSFPCCCQISAGWRVSEQVSSQPGLPKG